MGKLLLPLFLLVLVTLQQSACAEDMIREKLHMAEQAEFGEGRARDPALASKLYCEAARDGNGEAAYRLGWMYFNGRGVEHNDSLAVGLFDLAQKNGYAFAAVSKQHLQNISPAIPECLIPPVAQAPDEVPQSELDNALAQAKPPQTALIRLVHEMAPIYGVDPRLVLSVMLVESNFSINATSLKGAQGLMQLIPETAQRFNVKRPFDSRENIRGGLSYLRWLLAYYHGRMELVLAGYNAGEKAVDRYHGVPPYPETRDYVRKVLSLYRNRLYSFDSTITTASPAFP